MLCLAVLGLIVMEDKQAALPPPLAISFSHGLLLLTTLTMPKFNPYKVYAEELSYFSGEWLGYPLWCPEPENGEEVQIGDVGHIFHGRFRRFFNIFTQPAEDGPSFHYNMEYGVDSRVCLGPGTHASEAVKIIKGKADM